jgi:hypothetical protein
MTYDERLAINERIDAMIGSYVDFRDSIKDMNLSDSITAQDKYNKLRDKLFKIAEKHGEKALVLTMIQDGNTSSGVTPNGKKFFWYANNGYSIRSRHCGTLYIEGVGTIFTSGTVAKAFEYILEN